MEVKRKVVLLGDAAVGKTSLVKRFVYDMFEDRYIVTIGTKVSKKTIKMEWGGLSIDFTLMVWDVLGQQGYTRVQEAAFRGADGALLVCDLTRRETLTSISAYWLPMLTNVAAVPSVLLANKCDLPDWQIDEPMLERAAEAMGVPYFLTSAKTGENVEEAFTKLARLMLLFEPVEVGGETRHRMESLKDILDYVINDFAEKHWNMEDAMAIVTAQLNSMGVDIRNPTIHGVKTLIERLYAIEKDYLPLEEAQQNRIKRLSLLKHVKWA
jgi:small GTP-binding protein